MVCVRVTVTELVGDTADLTCVSVGVGVGVGVGDPDTLSVRVTEEESDCVNEGETVADTV